MTYSHTSTPSRGSSERLQTLRATGRLPSPKGVALELVRISQNEETTPNQIAQLVKCDPALAGRILKAANSPVLGSRRPVVSISEAVMLLGMAVVRQLALSFSLVEDYKVGKCPAFHYEEFWQTSLLTGIAGQMIAQRMRIVIPEEAFVCGLLGEVGRLALATIYPDEYTDILERCEPNQWGALKQQEQAAFATDFIELTAMMLQDWGLPSPLIMAVKAHFDPVESNLDEGGRTRQMANALSLARQLATIALLEPVQRRPYLNTLLFQAAKVGIDAESLAFLADEIVKGWKEWGAVLDIPTTEPGKLIDLSLPAYPAPGATNTPNSAPSIPIGDGGNEQPRDVLRVLIVDDDPSILLLLKKMMQNAGHEVITAQDGEEALMRALEFRPELVIADWVMPKMDGLQLVRALRETEMGQGIYILLLTSFGQDEKLVEAFDAGVDDYVTKPFVPRILAARLHAGERFIHQQRALSHDVEEIRKFATELAVNNRKLQQAVMTDPLTGLPNRRYAMDRLEQEVAAARRRQGGVAIMIVDIDHFKKVNDQFGHDAGDAVLRHVSGLLRAKARLQDAICRLGGEEFLVVCPDSALQDVHRAGERLRAVVESSPFMLGDRKLWLTISVGIACLGDQMQSAELIKAADIAVYRAKEQGRNRVCG
ncbi:diguanylate cyclase [Parvibium lacunae]|nr:diguanylate cyclase [Parvibium lacunae]